MVTATQVNTSWVCCCNAVCFSMTGRITSDWKNSNGFWRPACKLVKAFYRAYRCYINMFCGYNVWISSIYLTVSMSVLLLFLRMLVRRNLAIITEPAKLDLQTETITVCVFPDSRAMIVKSVRNIVILLKSLLINNDWTYTT